MQQGKTQTNNEYIQWCIKSHSNKRCKMTSPLHSNEMRSYMSGVATWRIIVHLKQRLTYQDEVMKGWQHESSKTKRSKNFQFSSLKSLINKPHLLQANSTANIVIHNTDSKWMIKPHNHSQLYGKQQISLFLVNY